MRQTAQDKSDYNRVYYLSNRDKIKKRKNIYRDTTLNGRLLVILGNSQSRAIKKKFINEIDKPFLIELYYRQNGRCALTGEILSLASGHTKRGSNLISLDRINNDLGYTKDNVRFVTSRVNYMRGNMTTEEFISLCGLISEFNI